MSFIELSNVSFKYPGQDFLVLSEINLSIEKGEFISLCGANSSGKTTLGRLINALLLPIEGKVIVDFLDAKIQSNVIPIRKKVGMIFQNPDNQIVATTVEEEVAFGPENLCLPSAEIRERVERALSITGLKDYRNYPPHLLSGGQKQLLAIASVLAMEPDCIIFDEPTSLLDPSNRRIVINKIKELNDNGMTVLLITHRMEEVLLSKKVIVLKDGKITFTGSPLDLFSLNTKALIELNLYPPEIVQIINKLREKGLYIPKEIVNSVDLVNYICQ